METRLCWILGLVEFFQWTSLQDPLAISVDDLSNFSLCCNFGFKLQVSNVASATKTTWQVPRLMSLVHFHTWHVNQLMKVNMNKFTIINGSSVLTVHVWWISRRVFINETTFPSLSPQRTFWCYVKLKIILISHSGFAGTSRILMQFPPVLHSSGFLWPMFFT